MNSESKIKAFVVDDEPLAVSRLVALLDETKRVEITGSTNNPVEAVGLINSAMPDVLFLDIKMPVLTGFEMLEKLDHQPPVVFTTAFDEHSLNAFEYFSIDYLLKPIERERLEAALDKVERISTPDASSIKNMILELQRSGNEQQTRISSRVGSKVSVLDLEDITHFISEDKVTFAITADGRSNPVEQTLNSLEKSLDSDSFLRIHRATIANLNFVEEIHGWFAGGVTLRLKGESKTELSVARSRVKELKKKLGM